MNSMKKVNFKGIEVTGLRSQINKRGAVIDGISYGEGWCSQGHTTLAATQVVERSQSYVPTLLLVSS